MASQNGSITTNEIYGRSITLNWSVASQSSATNKTVINYSIVGSGSLSGDYYVISGPITVNINGTNVYAETGRIAVYKQTLKSGTLEISHNNDGSKTFSASISAAIYDSSINASASGSWELPTIPRYATCQQSLASKTETSITMNWSSDNTIDYVWYSTNGGTNWTAVGSVNATSGSYTISGLTANTTYSIKTRVRRKDSQLTTDSTATSVTTYKIVAQSMKSKTVNSITMNWSLDTTANYIWYSINNGSTWVAVGAVNATSGTYTISGLSPNTAYNIKTRARRSATSTTSDSVVNAITTYDIAKITGSANWTIGNNTSVSYTNPSGSASVISLGIYYSNTTSLVPYRVVTSSPYTFNFTATENNNLYNSIPNSTNGKVRIYINTNCNGTNYTHYVERTIYVDQAYNKPTFTNFTFADTNSGTTTLTGNNQIFVKGLSQATVTISTANKAVAKNGASIVKYRITIGTKSTEVAYSSSESVSGTINAVDGASISVSAIDSRGLENTVVKTATWKDYWLPKYSEQTFERENGIGTKVLFNLKGTYWNNSFGSVSNTISAIRLTYKEKTASTWNSYIDVTHFFTISNGTFESNDGAFLPTTSGGSTPIEFEVGKEYQLRFRITDQTYTNISGANTDTTILTLNSGIPCTDKYKDSNGNYHVGINQLAEANNALAVGGAINIPVYDSDNGKPYAYKQGNNVILRNGGTNTVLAGANGGSIYFRPNGHGVSTGQMIIDKTGKVTTASGAGIEMGQLPVYTGDLNDLDSTTMVYCNGTTNAPSGAGAGYCIHLVYRTTYMRQIYYGATIHNAVYTRIKNNGTWGAWIRNIFNTGGQFVGELSSTGTFNQGSWGAKATGALSQIIDNTHAQHAVITGKDSSGNRHYSMELYDSTETNGRRMRLYTGNSALEIPEGSSYLRLYKGSLYAYYYGLYNLYYNDTGSNGTITLNETAANFVFVDIYFKDNNGYLTSIRLHQPNGKYVMLSLNNATPTTTYIKNRLILINDTSVSTYGSYYSSTALTANSTTITAGNYLYITRIDGFRGAGGWN